MEESKEIEIDLRSDSMNEMLSHPPSWITRSGNGLFLFVLILVIGLSWLIEYPDQIQGDVIVATEQPPIELKNQLYVQLVSLKVKEGQLVREGQLLVQFDTQAKSNDVDSLEKYVNKIAKIQLIKHIKLPIFVNELQLGSLEELWSILKTQVADWNTSLSTNLETEEIRSLQREIIYRERLEYIAKGKMDLSQREFVEIEKELKSSERLAAHQAISKQALNQDIRNHSQSMQTVQSQKEQYLQNLIQLNSLRKELLQLKNDTQIRERERLSNLELSIVTLKNRIEEWRKNAVWIAPCNGKVIFNKQLQKDRYYGSGEASIVIVPEGNQYLAVATIGNIGAGRIRKQQKTFIELLDYPKSEYGTLEGKVQSISQIDNGGKYEVLVKLPENLVTSYKKRVKITSQLKGTINIVTKKKRLFARFFEKIMDLIK